MFLHIGDCISYIPHKKTSWKCHQVLWIPWFHIRIKSQPLGWNTASAIGVGLYCCAEAVWNRDGRYQGAERVCLWKCIDVINNMQQVWFQNRSYWCFIYLISCICFLEYRLTFYLYVRHLPSACPDIHLYVLVHSNVRIECMQSKADDRWLFLRVRHDEIEYIWF